METIAKSRRASLFTARRGGYDAVRRHAAAWARERVTATAAAFVPLSFASDEAHQFDWRQGGSADRPVDGRPDEQVVLINGTTVTAKVAHVRLCHIRMLFVRA